MDFTVPENVLCMVRAVREFMQNEVYPLERDFLTASFLQVRPLLEQKREKVRAMGLWAPPIPEQYGGQGLSLLEFAHVSEELGRSPLGHYLFNCQAPDIGNMEILMQYGTDEQQEKYLVPLVRGQVRSCFAMTEPGYPGSNPTRFLASLGMTGWRWSASRRGWPSTRRRRRACR